MDREANRESRRKFLKSAGKFAVYTPPALMIMSQSSPQAFANSGGGYTGNEGGSENNNNQNCGSGLLGKLFCKL